MLSAHRLRRWLIGALGLSLLAACSAPGTLGSAAFAQPEGSSGYTPKPGWATTRFAVAAANPLATQAGYQVLKAGGSAIDAAVAVQMVLSLVEPQSSGIGGGAFLLHAEGSQVEAFDGRETAPMAADEQLFLGADGKPLPFYDAVVGGRSVGTPGTVRMLEMAHRQYGRLPWAQLFAPAIELADRGFTVSPRLAALLRDDKYLKDDPVAAAYFYQADGTPVEAGSTLKNPALADVLRQIASQGADAMLTGQVAQSIVAKVQKHPRRPGQLAMSDLAGYRARKREPICSDYTANAKTYVLCGMPPPSSGALAIGQILGMLTYTPASGMSLVTGMGGVAGTAGLTPSADWLHLYLDAARLAFADRAQYVADPDFVQPPAGSWMSLLAPDYLAGRAKLIQAQSGGQSIKTAQPGVPGVIRTAYAPMPDQPEHGTSHISIVDGYGNAVAMTTTIEDQFGARLMTDGGTGKAGGFLLNNELTDFSFVPFDDAGKPVANRVQPGKRPRSSMAPTLVFDKATRRLVMTAGSPGGAMIIHYTAKTLYGVLNWGLNAQQAIDLPNFGSLNGPSLLEANRFAPATVEALRARGAEVHEQPLTSGLQAIQARPGGWFGGSDPRREGLVLGD
ncbi:MAG: gamma-glutamyltransferase [Polaromonas sp. 39-63-203]|jgi:gamma-glutamyltranspeptidase/glutathione hydrolase|uniref:gamma-glutamyltransferase family protein n=1 Tax=Polaromonas sp. TaxID=1869339 RepID=UPI000BC8BC42|nr:gamma-glutamyltransferase family protein [Polaromonas sp.]OYY52432.1 MAG: gamma-glutamyltransferase [Polaromonas sp. 35-63-240]OYY96733.1 MAG: gamma-glutamyltransferase [Polaromonas sp. 28-63-22]OYZ83644.1 MAG: gamma-glutamyltransferase [Polaromonas sp. 24-62-144]OZA97850.1 MAG: gamma-glutamyltransferase [Polaromonas sp. 39-63-203]HQS32978.1 gamma-glutamyltransferase family protein [Polaromonas sp.]